MTNWRVICDDHQCEYIGRIGKAILWEQEVVHLEFGNGEEAEFFFSQVDATEDEVTT